MIRPQTPEQVLYHRRLRETAVLFALFVIPGVIAPGDVGALAVGLRMISATALRNVAFALLILYITDIQGERALIVGERQVQPVIAVAIAAALLILSIVMGILLPTLLGEPGPSVFASVPPARADGVRWALLSVLMLTVAWVEELFFRGYLLLRARQLGAGPLAAVTVSAALFAVGHGYQGVGALVYAFSAGVFLGILWIRRPSLISFTLGHGVYNIVALMLISP